MKIISNYHYKSMRNYSEQNYLFSLFEYLNVSTPVGEFHDLIVTTLRG